jgi:hypothetical protein
MFDNNAASGTDFNKAADRTMFVNRQWMSFAACTDGLSNTIAISECVAASGPEDRRIKGGVALVGAPAQTPISKCGHQAIADPNNRSVIRPGQALVNSTANNPDNTNIPLRCWRFADGRPHFTSGQTMLAPNSPSCNGQANAQDNCGVYSMSSNHTGGVNVGLFDGAVSFVSETIDCNGSNSLQPEIGVKSPYGIWGALGTPRGGESNVVL